jgi:hypothetical protein
MSDFGYGEVDSIQVDVSLDNVTWNSVYVGTVIDATWDTKAYTLRNIQYARFRFHRLTTGYIMWLYELQLYEAALTIDLPTVTTTSATSVDKTSAIVHGLLNNDGGEPSDLRFQYGLTTAYEIGSTLWVSGYVTGNAAGSMITGLSSGVTYHFRVQARNSQGTANGLDSSFTCAPAGAGWLSPTDNSDATGRWVNNPYSYDDEVASFAKCYHASGDANGQWSPYIYLLHDSIVVDTVRFLAKADINIDRAQIDVTSDGSTWISIYDAAFVNQIWTMIPFSSQYVNQVRARFHISSNSAGLYWELDELDLYTSLGEAHHLSVAIGNSTFAFGVSTLNSWLAPQTSSIVNNGNVIENLVGRISQFTDGSSNWGISAGSNGSDIIRAQWSITSGSGPWVDIAAYNTDFTIATNVAVGNSVTLWLKLETPTSTSSYNQHSSVLTATAQEH